MKKYIVPSIVIITIWVLDYWSKAWILSNLYRKSMEIFPFLHFTYAENTGVAFGMFQNSNMLLLIATTCILIGLIIFRKDFVTNHKSSQIGYWFVIAGALGNITDRILYRYVVDFVDLSFFPAVFNVADSAITVGAILMGWGLLLESRKERMKKRKLEAKDGEI